MWVMCLPLEGRQLLRRDPVPVLENLLQCQDNGLRPFKGIALLPQGQLFPLQGNQVKCKHTLYHPKELFLR